MDGHQLRSTESICFFKWKSVWCVRPFTAFEIRQNKSMKSLNFWTLVFTRNQFQLQFEFWIIDGRSFLNRLGMNLQEFHWCAHHDAILESEMEFQLRKWGGFLQPYLKKKKNRISVQRDFGGSWIKIYLLFSEILLDLVVPLWLKTVYQC